MLPILKNVIYALSFFTAVGAGNIVRANSYPASSQRCIEALNAPIVVLEVYREHYVLVNDIAVTGEFLYPLTLIKENLNLSPTFITSLRGKNVLSLAEGFSGLVPALLEAQVPARGLDLWYHTKDYPLNYSGIQMRQFVSTYGESLIRGDATRIPLPNERTDVILSHMLLNNLDSSTQDNVLREVLRILKPGGEAHLFPIFPREIGRYKQRLGESNYKHIIFNFEEKSIEDKEAYLLLIEKH